MEQVKFITLLISTIGALCGVVVSLALYIRHLHNRSIKNEKEVQKTLIEITHKVTEAIVTVNHSIESQIKTVEMNRTLIRDSIDRNTSILDDLHKYLLSATIKTIR